MTGQELQNAVWTTKRLLAWMRERFEAAGIDSPRVVAEMLLSHVLKCNRVRLYMEVDRPASADELATLRGLVKRALDHEPAQYLVGEAWFYSRPFEVDRSTLIPRPSTEAVIDAVIGWVDGNRACYAASGEDALAGQGKQLRIADIGTGTGCIAITLALQCPDARIVATDIKAQALELARRNAARHRVTDRIEFRAGDLFEPLRGGGELFDAICSNPPYIPDHEWDAVDRNVKDHEPASALRGGADGLNVIRPLIGGAADHLQVGGRLFVEIADCQRDAVRTLIESTAALRFVDIIKDHEGLWRVAIAERA